MHEKLKDSRLEKLREKFLRETSQFLERHLNRQPTDHSSLKSANEEHDSAALPTGQIEAGARQTGAGDRSAETVFRDPPAELGSGRLKIAMIVRIKLDPYDYQVYRLLDRILVAMDSSRTASCGNEMFDNVLHCESDPEHHR